MSIHPVFVISEKVVAQGVAPSRPSDDAPAPRSYRETRVRFSIAPNEPHFALPIETERLTFQGTGDFELVFLGDAVSEADELVVGDRYTLARAVELGDAVSEADELVVGDRYTLSRAVEPPAGSTAP
jgi:hypothetical protein